MTLLRLGAALYAALLALAGSSPASSQTSFEGQEPNQNKFEATPALNMVAGDRLISRDCILNNRNVFRVGTAPAPPGIYAHQLSAPSGSGTFLGAELQGVDALYDLTLPNSVALLADSQELVSVGAPQRLTWYGFGKSEELYVDMAPNTNCRFVAANIAVLSTEQVTPQALLPLEIASPDGELRLALTVSSTLQPVNTELQLFDSEFNPLYANGSDDPSLNQLEAGLLTFLDAGRYYVAVSDHELATHLPPSIFSSENNAPAAALDFPGGIVNGSSDFPVMMTLRVFTDFFNLSEEIQLVKTEPFEVMWFQLDVTVPGMTTPPQSTQSFCAGDGSLQPCPACSTDAAPFTGTGCRNSTGRGARLAYVRTVSTSAVANRFHLEGMPANTSAMIFIGADSAAPGEAGGGLFCLAPGAYRQPVVTARQDGMATTFPFTSQLPMAFIGQTVYAQAAYRDAGAACGVNLTNGVSFLLR